MESLQFAKVLRKLEGRKTPITNDFENETNDKGERLYGQREKRWWDKSSGKQVEHLICWFSRMNYGGTQKCVREHFGKDCMSCYFEKTDPEVGVQKKARVIFNMMKKPEMYICIAELFELYSNNELKQIVNEIKKTFDKQRAGKEDPRYVKWKDVINKYITWDKVEKKAIELTK